MKRIITASIKNIVPFCLMLGLLVLGNTNSWGELNFRSLEDDRGRLERYIDEADSSGNLAEWDNAVNSGRQALRAEWERAADLELERLIREEGDTADVRASFEQDRQEAVAEWEAALSAEIASARGRFYAARQDLGYLSLDNSVLETLFQGYLDDTDNQTIEQWEDLADQARADAEADWNTDLANRLETARNNAASLSGDARAAYLAEVDRIEAELRNRVQSEGNTLEYKYRNSYIKDRYFDQNSLRKASEAGSADAVTDQILSQVTEELQKESDAIFNRDTTSGNGSTVDDFTTNSSEYEAEIKRLIDAGLARWKEAEDLLFSNMLIWKENAQDAYDAGEAKWAESYNKLVSARDKWQAEIEQQINDRLGDWQNVESELLDNIAEARTSLNSYLNTVSNEWSDHSQTVKDMVLNGSDAYFEAVDNVAWLEDMVEHYEDSYTFHDSANYVANNTSGLIQDLIAEGHQSWFTDLYTQVGNLTPVDPEPELGMYSNEDTASTTIMNKSVVDIKVTPQFNGFEVVNGVPREKYSLTFTCTYKFTVKKYIHHRNGSTSTITKNYTQTITTTRNWTNNITRTDLDDSDPLQEKEPPYFFYSAELERWKGIRDNLNTIISQAENQMHNADMQGETVTINGEEVQGSGLLTNANGEYELNEDGNNDPYLMTTAELNFKLAEKELAYWEERLEVAKAVRDYAYSSSSDNEYWNGSVRESADVTTGRMEQAKAAMETAENNYQTVVSEINSIVEELRQIQGSASDIYNSTESAVNSIAVLTQELSKKKDELAAAKIEYQKYMDAVILFENQEDHEFVAQEIEALEQSIAAQRVQVADLKEQYYTRLREAERVDRLKGFADLFSATVRSYQESKDGIDSFDAVVSGSESSLDLAAVLSGLNEEKEAIWGSDTTGIDALNSLYTTYQNADTADKESAKEDLVARLRFEKQMLELSEKQGQTFYDMLIDADFDIEGYLSGNSDPMAPYYKNAAEQNKAVFDYLVDTYDSLKQGNGTVDVTELLSELENLAASSEYIFGDSADNSASITARSAYEWAVMYLQDTQSDDLMARLQDEQQVADGIVDIYNNSFDPADYTADADNGDAMAIRLLKEYYTAGSEMGALDQIKKLDNSLEIASVLSQNEYQYVYTYANNFAASDAEITTDFATRFINETANLENSESFGLDDMSIDELSMTAKALSDFFVNNPGANIPASILEQLEAISSLQTQLETYTYIRDHISDDRADAQEAYIAAKELSDSAAEAAVFFENTLTALQGNTAYSSLGQYITSKYEELSDGAKAYLVNTDNFDNKTNEALATITGIITDFQDQVFEQTKRQLAADYLGQTTLTREQFLSMHLDNSAFDADEKAEITSFIRLADEKRMLADKDTSTALAEYIAARPIDQDDADALTRYGLVKNFMETVETGSQAGTDPALLPYFQALADNNPNARELLPEDVQFYLACNDYYEGVYADGTALNAGEIETYISEHASYLDVSGTVYNELVEYIGGMNAVQHFYGQEITAYMSGLNNSEQLQLQRFRYLDQSGIAAEWSLMGTFESGVYGLRDSMLAEIALYEGMNADRVRLFADTAVSIIDTLDKDARNRAADTGIKQELVRFIDTPELFENYRLYVRDVVEENETEENAPDTTIVQVDDGDSYTVVLDTPDEESDPEDFTVLYSAGTAYGLDGDTAVSSDVIIGNNIIETSNLLAAQIKVLLKSSSTPDIETASGNDVFTIRQFLDRAGEIYESGQDYSKDGDQKYGYESALDTLISNVTSLSVDRGEQSLEALRGQISSLDGAVTGMQNEMLKKGRTYRMMNPEDADSDELRNKLAEAMKQQSEIQAAYDKLQEELGNRNLAYQQKNKEYQDKMDEIAVESDNLGKAQHSYDLAYAVYEYANTPYLKESATLDPGVAEGETDFSELAAPDARDEYERILKKYTEAQTARETALTAKNEQETLESLREHADYKPLRDRLVRLNEQFSRVSQVEFQVDEKLAVLEQEYNQQQAKYDSEKAQLLVFQPYRENEDDEVSVTYDGVTYDEEAVKARTEQILADMTADGTGSAKYKQYLSAMEHYYIMTEYEKIKDKYADKDVVRKNREREEFIYAQGLEDIKNNVYSSISDEIWDNVKFLIALDAGAPADAQDIIRYGSLKVDEEWRYQRYRRFRRDAQKCKVFCSGEKKNRRASDETQKKARKARETAATQLLTPIATLVQTRNELAAKRQAYADTALVRSVEEVRTFLQQELYSLDIAETGLLYDRVSVANEGADPSELININALRTEMQRLDADGKAVKAIVKEGRVVLLDINGKELDESYAISDAVAMESVVLRKEEGGDIADNSGLTEGSVYYLYDNVYSLAAVMDVLKNSVTAYREDAVSDYDSYVAASLVQDENGNTKHDMTVILRDKEAIYWDMAVMARDFNRTETEGSETRQRTFAGYQAAIDALLFNSNGDSVSQTVMSALANQNMAFQEQLWEQQERTLLEKQNRWVEVVGFLSARGNRDWNNRLSQFENQWRTWRIKTLKEIEQGSEEYVAALEELQKGKNAWNTETAHASSKEISRHLVDNVNDRIKSLTDNLKLPKGVDISIDSDSILNTFFENTPGGLGILGTEIGSVNTTAGFSSMLNLGLTDQLTASYDKQMDEFTERMSIMQNLKVTDVLFGIIENFESQLEQANMSVEDGIEDMGYTQFAAPFKKKGSQWSIRVVTSKTLLGTKKKTFSFDDYRDLGFADTGVMIAPIKGLNGSIDFNDPSTFMHLDAGELDTYVRLESERLNRSIQGVFGTKGSFSTHSADEQDRLIASFTRNYQRYVEGEAKAGMDFHEVPIVPGAPSLRVVAQIAGSIALCATGAGVGAAMALNAAFSTMDVASGAISIEQALVQTAVATASSAVGGYGGQFINMGASGIDYKADGGIGWDADNVRSGFKKGIYTMALNAGMNSAFSAGGIKVEETLWAQAVTSTASTTFSSAFNGRGKLWDISFDNKNWMQHITAGVAAGSTTLAMGLLNDNSGTDSSNSQIDGNTDKNTNNTYDTGKGSGSWLRNPFANKAISSALNQGIMNLGYAVSGGKGFRNDYVNGFNWNALTYNHVDIGSYYGSKFNAFVNDKVNEGRSDPNSPMERKNQQKGLLELWLGGIWESRKGGSLGKDSQDDPESFVENAGVLGEGANWEDLSEEEQVSAYMHAKAEQARQNGNYTDYFRFKRLGTDNEDMHNFNSGNHYDNYNLAKTGEHIEEEAIQNAQKLHKELKNDPVVQGILESHGVSSLGQLNGTNITREEYIAIQKASVATLGNDQNAVNAFYRSQAVNDGNQYGTTVWDKQNNVIRDKVSGQVISQVWENGKTVSIYDGTQRDWSGFISRNAEKLQYQKNNSSTPENDYQQYKSQYDFLADNNDTLFRNPSAEEWGVYTLGTASTILGHQVDVWGKANLMYLQNSNSFRLYTPNVNGNVFQGNQHTTRLLTQNGLKNISRAGSVGATFLSVLIDYNAKEKGQMTEHRFQYNSVVNVGLGITSVTPAALATIPLGLINMVAGDSIYARLSPIQYEYGSMENFIDLTSPRLDPDVFSSALGIQTQEEYDQYKKDYEKWVERRQLHEEKVKNNWRVQYIRSKYLY